MKALRWHARNDIRVDDVDEPAIASADDVIIAVEANGLCGSDREEVRHGPNAIPTSTPHPLTGAISPVTLGHEIVGRVVATGDNSTALADQRVVVTPVIACGTCTECSNGHESRCERLAVTGLSSNGGLAAKVKVTAHQCVRITDALPATHAALAEPYSIVIHGLEAVDVDNKVVCVVGFGSIGASAADVAFARNAARVIAVDPSSAARELARRGNADAAHPDDISSIGADVVIEASGATRGLATSIAAAGAGGTVVALGLRGGEVPIPLPTLIYQELNVVARVGLTRANLEQAARGLSSRHLGTRFHQIRTVDLHQARRALLDHSHPSTGEKLVYLADKE